MFNTIKSVKPAENFSLIVKFNNGITKLYDVKPLFKAFETFNDLLNIDGLFNQVKVDVGGYGIVWNEDLDLSCDELFDNGIEL